MSEPINTPFNYTGSKFKLLPQLVPLFDRTKSHFLDLFAGGGSVYTNVVDLYEKVWANDRIAELIGIHEALLTEGVPFIERVKALCVAKDDQAGYVALRDLFNRERRSEQLYALMLCCTNNMMRFNQSLGFNQTFGRRTFNPSTQAKLDAWLAHMGPHREKVHFTAQSFDQCQPRDWQTVMVYADPPYAGTEAGYNAYWLPHHEQALYDYLTHAHQQGGSFAISGVMGGHKGEAESVVLTKLAADGHEVVPINHDYGKVSRDKESARGQEVLIRNYRT